MSGSDRKENSTAFMLSFVLGVCFSAIYIICYGFLTGVLYRYASLPVPDLVNSVLHSILISIVGTAICCIFFLMRNKMLVPFGFVWMAFFLVVACMFAAVHFEGADRWNLLTMLSMFGLAPVIIGNAVSWIVYRRLDGQAD